MTDEANEAPPPLLDWGWAGYALQMVSGDLHVVAPFAQGMLVGLLDGLGHGPEAGAASQIAAAVLGTHADEDVAGLFRRCHEILKKTRGVAMSLASFNGTSATMTWSGVGNVDGLLFRPQPETGGHQALSSRGGVVGYNLPPLRVETLPVSRGDLLIFTTDGIESRFSRADIWDATPQELADSILGRFLKKTDDAHVLVARYLGGT